MQRHLDLPVQPRERVHVLESGPEHPVQPQRDVRVLGGVVPGLLERDLVEGQLPRALAGDILEVDGVVVQVLLGQRVHVVPRRGAIEHVALEHGVVDDPTHRDRVARQDAHVVFEVLSDLRPLRVLEQWPQALEDPLPGKLIRGAGIGVRQRNIGRLPGLDAEREADQLGPHVVQVRRFGVERDQWRGLQTGDPVLEGRLGEHQVVIGLSGPVRCVPSANGALAERGEQPFRLEAFIPAAQGFSVRLGWSQLVRNEVERDVVLDPGQLPGQ